MTVGGHAGGPRHGLGKDRFERTLPQFAEEQTDQEILFVSGRTLQQVTEKTHSLDRRTAPSHRRNVVEDLVHFAEPEHRHRRGSQWLCFADCRAADADPPLPRLTRQEGDGDIDLRGIDSSEQRCELADLGETGACLRHCGTCLNQLVKKHRGPFESYRAPPG